MTESEPGPELEVCATPGCGWWVAQGASCTRCEALGSPIAPPEVSPVVTPEPLVVIETPQTTGSTPPKSVPEPDLAGADQPLGPEVHVYRTPRTGVGLLRVGNPGNRGGCSYPRTIRGQLRRILEEHGIDYLENVVRGLEPHYYAVPHVGLVAGPTPIAERTRAALGIAALVEVKPATEKPGTARAQVLKVIHRQEA